MEFWKSIKGYENLYEVSNLGNIKSFPKKTRKGTRILKKHMGNNYYLIDLVKDKKVKKHLIHRLVANSFLENTEKKEQVNHIDGNKLNNNVENLEWNTRSENQLHSIKIGLRTTIGEKNSQSKLNEKSVLKIFIDKRKYKEIIQEYNISISTISDIKRGYSWTHITGIKNIKNRKQILAIK